MHINSKKYPLHISKEIEQVLTELKQITENDHAIIQLIRKPSYLLSIVDKDSSSGFYFDIQHASINKKKQVVFTTQFLPGNGYSTVASELEVSGEALVQKLHWWIGIIADYNTINYNLEQWENNFTIQEHELQFELKDEDAYTHPYDKEKQRVIEKLLENIIKLLEEKRTNPLSEELLKETNSISSMLSTATKNVIATKLISLLKKLSSMGIELIKEVIKHSAAELLQLGFKTF